MKKIYKVVYEIRYMKKDKYYIDMVESFIFPNDEFYHTLINRIEFLLSRGFVIVDLHKL